MDEKKKVAILLPWMKMGGTNKIALHFMRELSAYCDVTLILSQNTGELLEQLPENIHLVIDPMQDFQTIAKFDLKHFRLGKLFRDVLYYARIRMGRDSVDNYRYLVQRNDFICDTEFDCAISYHGQSPERLLNLLYRVHAGKKVAWIHGEFHNSADHYRRMERYYRKLDRLFFVSQATRDSCLAKMVLDPGKCSTYRNPIDIDEVLTKAQSACDPAFDKNYVNLLTVGRISREKGQDMIPAIARNLLDDGYPVRWYLIGDGDNRSVVEQNIRRYGVENAVILLGTKTNPYSFMRSCDIYVQPSYTEGYSTTICEAGILGKAIVGTASSGGIREQITDGEDGLIAQANVDSLTGAITRLLDDPDLRAQFEKNITHKTWNSPNEIHKFLTFLEIDEGNK